jgi:hypothetical protein
LFLDYRRIDFWEQALGSLLRDPLPKKLLGPTILFYQFLAVFVHVFQYSIELRAGERGHNLLDASKIITSVQIVKDVEHSNPRRGKSPRGDRAL